MCAGDSYTVVSSALVWRNYKMQILTFVFAASLLHVLYADSDECVFISKSQTIYSSQYEKLQNMTLEQCKFSDTDVAGRHASCKNQNELEHWKLECFCALKLHLLDECDPNQWKLCCRFDEVHCFNGGQIQKNKAKCNTTSKLIFSCQCPTVLGGDARYHGDRCESIPVIRICTNKSDITEKLKRCDVEENTAVDCIHTLDEVKFLCGPAKNNIKGLALRQCRGRSRSSDRKDPSDDELTKWKTAGITMFVVCFALCSVLLYVGLQYCRLRNKYNRSNSELQRSKDRVYEEGWGEAQKPLLKRSISVPTDRDLRSV